MRLLVVVGMPEKQDLAEGRLLTGPGGRLFWSLARRAGISPDNVDVVSVITSIGEGSGGDATKAQVDANWDSFDAGVRACRGRAVLCLGALAFERLTGIFGNERTLHRRSGIDNWRGYLVSPRECVPRTRTVTEDGTYKSSGKNKAGVTHRKGDPRKIKVKVVVEPVLPEGLEYIIPALDPMGVMRSGLKTLPALMADVERAGRAMRGELRLTTVEFEQHPYHLGGKIVVVDIETPANPVESNVILRVGAASHEGAWTSEWTTNSRSVLRDLCGNGEMKVLHNHAFDRPRLEAYDVPVRGRVRDTMLMAAMAQPDLYKGLNSVASLYLDTPKWKHLAGEDEALYNAWDCVKTLEVHDAIEMELQRTSQIGLLDNTIMPGSDTLMRMTQRGVKLDEATREKWVEDLDVQVRRAEEAWAQATGINPRATAKVREWLDARAVPRLDSAYNKFGGVTTDASALRDVLKWCLDQPEGRYEGVHDAVRALLAYRESSKMLSTYTSYPLDDDSCVHPSYLPGAKDDDNEVTGKGLAGTWRITSREPNFHNIPPEAKHMFIPHHPDLTFIEADWSQAELRVIGGVSGDQGLLGDLDNTDIFQILAEDFTLPRPLTKLGVYATAYGAGARTLVKQWRANGFMVDEKVARSFQDRLFARYPKWAGWSQRIKEKGQAQFYLTNPYGLRRYFYNRNDVPAMIDFVPQSTVAIMMWQTVRELSEYLRDLGGWVVNTVHDSVLCEIPKGKEEEGERRIKEVMEKPRREVHGVEVPVKVKKGTTWGNLQ